MKNVWEVWSRTFSSQDCDRITERANAYSEVNPTIGFADTSRSDLAYRSCAIRWLDAKSESWLVDQIMHLVGASNRTNFGVDIETLYELQFTEYQASNEGHYDWHHDVWLESPRPFSRKLSVVVQLSDPQDYQGGIFEFFGLQNPGVEFSARGSVLIFPSFLQHRVLPVTKGVRRSLVTWIEGPNWR